MTGKVIEGLLRAALIITAEVRKLLDDNPPDLDLPETLRLQELVEEDLAAIRRWRERVRNG